MAWLPMKHVKALSVGFMFQSLFCYKGHRPIKKPYTYKYIVYSLHMFNKDIAIV